MQEQHGYDRPLRVGAAGGISTPWAAAAALAMGAAYLVTGSVNQSCVEAGTSDAVRRMLAQAQQADIAMAPAADMFEMGVKVQVLKRGTLFAMRAAKLYELYRAHDGLDQIPAGERANLEKTIFRAPLGDDLGADQGLFSAARPVADRAVEPRSQAKDGAGVSLVSGDVVALGQQRRAVANRRLPDLVRAGHGGVQRLGSRVVPRAARESPGGDRRHEYPLRRGGLDPRADRERSRGPPASRRAPIDAPGALRD